MLPTPRTQPSRSLDADQKSLLERWDRIGLGVRLAYNPTSPRTIRVFLQAGRRLAASGARSELDVQARTLAVLLDTALDSQLPLAWRGFCLEHVCLPLARLVSLGRRTGRVDVAAWRRRVEEAERRFAEAQTEAGTEPPDTD